MRFHIFEGFLAFVCGDTAFFPVLVAHLMDRLDESGDMFGLEAGEERPKHHERQMLEFMRVFFRIEDRVFGQVILAFAQAHIVVGGAVGEDFTHTRHHHAAILQG